MGCIGTTPSELNDIVSDAYLQRTISIQVQKQIRFQLVPLNYELNELREDIATIKKQLPSPITQPLNN